MIIRTFFLKRIRAKNTHMNNHVSVSIMGKGVVTTFLFVSGERNCEPLHESHLVRKEKNLLLQIDITITQALLFNNMLYFNNYL